MAEAAAEDACSDEEDIAAFLRGRLAPQRMRALETHVARCAACRRLLSALVRAAGMEPGPVADSASPTTPLRWGGGETELPLGARFGRYIVLDWLGAGGMGVVYAAYDPELTRKVALKVLTSDGSRSPAELPIRALLMREAQAMAQLAHPNVVAVHDVGSVDGRVFIAMEFVEGVTLTNWLAAERRAPGEIITTFLAAGDGLAAAHAAGVIHRDFKPDNVLIGNDGRVRVTDFGLARLAPGEPSGGTQGGRGKPAQAVSTARSGVVGTPAYMAPEQYLGRSADARADQFSFAVALHEALYGKRPFAPVELAIRAETPGRLVAGPRSGVSSALRRALSRALSLDPAQRHASMAELLAVLAPRQRRGRALALAAILAIAAAVTSAGAYASHLRAAAEQRTELVGRLRSVAPELRTMLRSAHLLPLHDIRPTRDRVRSAMHDVEQQRQTPAGQDESGLIDLVLGEGYQALGDHERALASLEAAWAAGQRGPDIDAALGQALGASYEKQLDQIEKTVPSARREAQVRALEERYREQALTHLRAALVARASSPAYLEALIAFHAHRFDESSQRADAALTESPMLYEAGVLQAKAHHEAARQLMAQDRREQASAEFETARKIFEGVLESARSDDEAWLGYGEMLYAQAGALFQHDELSAELKQKAITALHTARQINPESWQASMREADIYEGDANGAILSFQDPSAPVDKVLELASKARALGADANQVDVDICLAHWERAVYQSAHGIDPHPELGQAVAACERAATAGPNSDVHDSLGTVYLSLASYDGEHGIDPTGSFERGERSFLNALSLDDDPLLYRQLGRLYTKLAQYQASHGQSPERAVERALPEYDRASTNDATLWVAWTGKSDALVARAEFQRQQHDDVQPTLTQAREALERAHARAQSVPVIRSRIEIAALEAEARLDHNADPTSAAEQLRADAQQLMQLVPRDGFAYRSGCRADLVMARWVIAQRRTAAPWLTDAANEAEQARDADPMDALAWTASAEVEQLRAETARGAAPGTAIARGFAFVEHALTIDPRLRRALDVRDALTRRARELGLSASPP
jgi:serine/threonine protein kinase